MNFFKKKNKSIISEAIEEMEKEQEKENSSYTEFLRSIHKSINKPNNEEKFRKLFPRTIDSIRELITKADGTTVAMDSCVNFGRKFCNEISPEVFCYLNETFIGYQTCALLKQNEFIDRACTIPGKDAIAPDFKIQYINSEDAVKDNETPDIDELADIRDVAIRKFGIKEICVRHETNKRAFGYSIVVPIVDGVDYEKPFNIDGIRKGSYHGMNVIEAYWLRPELDTESATNSMSLHYFEPTWYVTNYGQKIHRSWVIRSTYSEVPDLLKPTYYFGGIPLTQQIFKRVYAAEKVANEAPMLAMTKRLLIVDANISNMVSNPSAANEIMEALTELRDNFGVYAKNPGDQVSQIDTSLTDFDALIMTQYQLVAAIAGMPATKLLKTTPKGFNSTGEFEDKDYKQSLLTIQENDFIPILNRHFDLYTKSVYGRVIPLDIKFNPIDTPTESEVANIASIKSQIAMNHINAGITTADEEREVLRNEDGSPYSALAEEIKDDYDPSFMEELNGGKEETSL